MAKAPNLLEPPVMRGRLERLDYVELEHFADPVSEHRPNTRNRLKQGFRAGTSLQVLEGAPPVSGQHFGYCARYRSADAGDRLQRFAPALLGDSAEIIV
jgi:hypothetical protein